MVFHWTVADGHSADTGVPPCAVYAPCTLCIRWLELAEPPTQCLSSAIERQMGSGMALSASVNDIRHTQVETGMY